MKNLILSIVIITILGSTFFISCQKEKCDCDTKTDTIKKQTTDTIKNSTLNIGLVAYYPFNGNAIDSSGNGNNGTVYGATLTTDRFGNPNSAYYFNGESAYIDIGNSVKIKRYQNDFSVGGWLNLYQYSSTYNSDILSNRYISGSFIGVGGLLSPWAKKLEFVKNTTVTNDIYSFDFLYSNTQLSLNQWYFFCVTYRYNGDSSNIVKIYLNGNLESQKQMGETLDPSNTNTFIGWEPNQVSSYMFNGSLDDIRIYNRVLLDSEIKELYASK